MGVPLVIIHFDRISPYKPTILGYPHGQWNPHVAPERSTSAALRHRRAPSAKGREILNVVFRNRCSNWNHHNRYPKGNSLTNLWQSLGLKMRWLGGNSSDQSDCGLNAQAFIIIYIYDYVYSVCTYNICWTLVESYLGKFPFKTRSKCGIAR